MKGQKASPRFLGGAAVAAAYAAWGTLTIFWNLLADVNPVYILAQRLIWSMVFMGIYMAVTGKLKDIAPAFKDKRTFLLCLACGALVTVNWGVYIYAVNSSHVLDASLGYFIEPVIVALIGMTAFKEKPSKYEKDHIHSRSRRADIHGGGKPHIPDPCAAYRRLFCDIRRSQKEAHPDPARLALRRDAADDAVCDRIRHLRHGAYAGLHRLTQRGAIPAAARLRHSDEHAAAVI